MTTQRFAFHHEWSLPGPAEPIVAALADIEHYPRWWPQVRHVDRLDDRSGRARIRSLLPMTLDLVLSRDIEDREGGHLRVAIDGDLHGWAKWSIVTSGETSTAVFDQEVRVAARLSRAATLAPAVLRANHAWMMRQGRHGLAQEITRR